MQILGKSVGVRCVQTLYPNRVWGLGVWGLKFKGNVSFRVRVRMDTRKNPERITKPQGHPALIPRDRRVRINAEPRYPELPLGAYGLWFRV